MRSGLDEFFDVLQDVRRVAVFCAGGLILLPLAAGLSGFMPPWPSGLVVATSLIELVIIIVNFQVLAQAPRGAVTAVIIVSAVLVLAFSATYLILNSIFVYQLPASPTRVVLGCGLSDNARAILQKSGAGPIRDDCPGEFSELLASAQYESEHVWTKSSVSLIKSGLAIAWLGAFAALASLTGVFVAFQRQTRAPARRPAPRAKGS